jgi:four helix bundle protein
MLKPKSEKSNNIRFRSYDFSLAIIDLVKSFPSNKVYLIFTDQLLRSATSVGDNLVEAKSASSKKDFARYYEIALKSSNETMYWLCLLRDAQLIESDKIANLINEIEEISKMIGSSLLTIRGKR